MNKFFRMTLKALALPIFVIRVINGALIRYIPSMFLLFYYLSGNSEMSERKALAFFTMVGIISLVWSFLYAFSTPSVPKLSYMYRNYPQKIKSLLKKRAAFWLAILLLGIYFFVNSAKLPIYIIIYICYVLASININTILMLAVSSMGYNPFFEELCYKKSNNYENATLGEIYSESGMGEILSKDGLKQTINGLKSEFKNGKKR